MAPAPPPPPSEGPPIDSGGTKEGVAGKAGTRVVPEKAMCLGPRPDMDALKGREERMEVGNPTQEQGRPMTRSRSNSAVIEFVRPSDMAAGRKKRRLDDGAEYDSADSMASSVDVEEAALAAKKGRSPNEGNLCAGLATAKVVLVRSRRREFLKNRGPRDHTDPAEVYIHKVREAIVEKTTEAKAVVKKSGNLKGTCQRQINDALNGLASLAESLEADLIPRSVTPLLRRNSDIQSELHRLQRENEELRAKIATAPSAESLRPTPAFQHAARSSKNANDWDTFRSQIMEDVGRMMERQTAELMRQVRQHDSSTAARLGVGGRCPQLHVPSPSPERGPNRGVPARGEHQTWCCPPSRNQREQGATVSAAGADKEGERVPFSDPIAKEGEGGPLAKQVEGPPLCGSNPRPPQEAEKAGASYAGILREAKAKIDLASLGIEELRFKSAATGARILEIPGSQSGEKADALAQKLREVLGENPVQVSRPTKTAEMRIMGLDDSVTPEDIAQAVSRDGECAPEEVKAGEIRLNPSGLGTCWVRAPILVVKKITTAARIKATYGCGARTRGTAVASASGVADLVTRPLAAQPLQVAPSAGRRASRRTIGWGAKIAPQTGKIRPRRGRHPHHQRQPPSVPSSDNWFGDYDGLVAVIRTGGSSASPPCLPLFRGSGYVGVSWGEIAVVGVYFSPNRTLAEFEEYLDGLGIAISVHPARSVLVMGGPQCQVYGLGSPITTIRGEVLEDWAVASGLSILNVGSVATCVRWQGESIVDISLASPAIAHRVRGWQVMDEVESLSDHRYIRFDILPSSGAPHPDRSESDTSAFPKWASRRLKRRAGGSFHSPGLVSNTIQACGG
ncbi:uncharacterized protein LOC131855725 [Achroia grisella]|uniref:uncharacterized protein LOC131855725 n=1 Tax=Achroia grisella TaxID=688607 RepID=UPI0027D2771C|nr:uncharacterized protein LOC131855725 [Achroia grisella]